MTTKHTPLFSPEETGTLSNTDNKDRPKAMLWGNVGMTLDMIDENGKKYKEFVSLPVGIPLDTTDPMEMRGRNPEWLKMVQAKNQLLQYALTVGKDLEAGEGRVVPQFEFQIQRVNDSAEVVKAEDNDLLAQLNSAFGITPEEASA